MYEMITRLVPTLQNAVYGTLKNETRVDEDGLPILPISFGLYHNWFLGDLGCALDEFERTYPDIHMDDYANILEKAGIEVSTKGIRAADASQLDGLTVMALIFGIFDIARKKDERNSEHFLDPDYEYDWENPLIDIFRDRSIERWLLRLQEIDQV